ncbi:MAG TPA: deoxyribodipyrimidine photo-lyase, partial [Marmoricola sp.]
AGRVVPLFVVDEAMAGFRNPNKASFLHDCLEDLAAELADRGAGLVVRRGHPTEEVRRLAARVHAEEVHLAADVSGYAQARQKALEEALAADGRRLVVHEGSTTAVPPGTVTPQDKDHAAVFTPYYRRWAQERLRKPLAAPRRMALPDGVRPSPLPGVGALGGGDAAPDLARGGEREARRRLTAWTRTVGGYAEGHDDLAGDATSRLSPYLHFGCLSPTEVVARVGRDSEGAEAFVRQIAWRDFHHQMLAARPQVARRDYRPRGDRWREDDEAFQAWREGLTGYPIVDAAMRQLNTEGWMHNRARLLVASFLTKTLYIDWRRGAEHFLELLVDGDIANNQLNWQWVAGTGADTRPNRVLNPLRQAQRFDPDGDFVRRYVPELRGIAGKAVHEPWRLPEDERGALDYPAPIVDLEEAAATFRDARGRS